MKKEYKRVCAHVDLDAILTNMRNMHGNIPAETRMLAVIKTDGYGHGAVPIARELEQEAYVFGYAVATAEEALILQRAGMKKPILILGYTFSDAYEDFARFDIRPTVFKEETARQLSECACRMNRKIKIHLKIDTGMSRIGFCTDEASVAVIRRILELPMLEAEGYLHILQRQIMRISLLQCDSFQCFVPMWNDWKRRQDTVFL